MLLINLLALLNFVWVSSRSVTSLATRNPRKPTVRVLLSASYAGLCFTNTNSKRAKLLRVLLFLNCAAAGTAEALYWKSTALWPTSPDGRHIIRVCWDHASTSSFPAERETIKDIITQTWSYYGNIQFSDWNNCPFGVSHAIVISHEDGWSYTPGLGTEMFGPMRLNFTWANSDPPFVSQNAQCTGVARERCNTSTALHEFGHALGFDHEFNRPDGPAVYPTDGIAPFPGQTFCIRDWWNSGSNSLTSSFDALSVMNYAGGCGGRHLALSLSPDDIVGLISAYGIGERYVATIVTLTSE
jgi:hypothetical protein